jgi:alpha-L-rhamnosidase
MHGLMLDGIKRDRMPWSGDQALNSLANAFAVGDARIARDSLEALGHPRDDYVNGIADYSLWWVINSRFIARYLGPATDPVAHAHDVEAFVSSLLEHVGDGEVFRPRRPDIPPPGPGTVFIDWGVDPDPDHDPTALQILWYWALTSLSETLETVGLDGQPWQDRAQTLRHTLASRGWNAGEGRWTTYLDDPTTHGLHANVLAVLSGLGSPAGTLQLHPDDVKGAGTPFMTTFALWALARSGSPTNAVDSVRELWGQMLDHGANTFWEDFVDGGSDHAMYGRPFGRSLCHAWSSGPAFLLPVTLLGIEPVDDGWTQIRVAPQLGDVAWASAVVPTPHGVVEIAADHERSVLTVPDGITVVIDNHRYAGPAVVTAPVSTQSGGTTRSVQR